MSCLAMCFQQCTTEVAKPNPTARSEVPVQENPVKENIYMPMKAL